MINNKVESFPVETLKENYEDVEGKKDDDNSNEKNTEEDDSGFVLNAGPAVTSFTGVCFWYKNYFYLKKIKTTN